MSTHKDIFQIIKDREEVHQDHPQYGEFMQIVANTLRLNVDLNNAKETAQVREILSEIIGSKIDESTAIFAPFHINFGKHTTIGKNVFINHACSFLDIGGITIEDDVLIGPKVNLITEGHPLDPNNRSHYFANQYILSAMLGLEQHLPYCQV